MPTTITFDDDEYDTVRYGFTDEALRVVHAKLDDAEVALASAPVDGSGAVNISDFDTSDFAPTDDDPCICYPNRAGEPAADCPVHAIVGHDNDAIVGHDNDAIVGHDNDAIVSWGGR